MAVKKFKNKNGIFAAVGAATGLGNAFRFPALCLKYGAAFIVAYAVALAAVCYPLLVAELGFGRRKTGGRAAEIWAAIMRAAAVNSAFIALYYGVIAAKLGVAGVSFAVFGGAEQGGVPPLFCLVFMCLSAETYIILIRAPRSLSVTGRLSVALSLALFSFLAAAGIVKGKVFSSFDISVLCGGSVWADALGQALLSLSLAAGIMPDFARAQNKSFSPRRTAFKIVSANFAGCLLAACATLPHIAFIPRTVGISVALTVYPQVVCGVFGSGAVARVCGAFTFAVLTAIAIHSLASLASPAVSRISCKFKSAPLIFVALSAALAPLFMYNGLEVLSACDSAACSVSAVALAFAESVFFASQGDIKGVTGVFLRFLCPAVCFALALFSLCSARFGCFSPVAVACVAVCTVAVVAGGCIGLRFSKQEKFLQ